MAIGDDEFSIHSVIEPVGRNPRKWKILILKPACLINNRRDCRCLMFRRSAESQSHDFSIAKVCRNLRKLLPHDSTTECTRKRQVVELFWLKSGCITKRNDSLENYSGKLA